MALIPQDYIERVLESADIAQVIGRYVPLKKSGSEFRACCPFHQERTPSFYVVPKKQLFHCFGCGVSGSVIGFLMERASLSFPEAVEQLAEECGLPPPPRRTGSSGPDNTPFYELMERCAEAYRENLKQAPEAQKYLKDRGFDDEAIRRFSLGYAPAGREGLAKISSAEADPLLLKLGMLRPAKEAGRPPYPFFRNRLMFPIRNRRGRFIAFGGRDLGAGKDTPKYINSPESPIFSKGRELYGLHEMVSAGSGGKRVFYVVEGYMDVISLHRHGFAGAVACLGTSLTESQSSLLQQRCDRAVFCFDGDAAGRRAAARSLDIVLRTLSGTAEISFAFMSQGQDPDDTVREDGEKFRRLVEEEALSLERFAARCVESEGDKTTVLGRERIGRRVGELLRPVLQRPFGGELKSAIEKELGVELSEAALASGEENRVDSRLALRRQVSVAPGPRSENRAVRGWCNTAAIVIMQQPELLDRFGAELDCGFEQLPGEEIKLLTVLFALGRGEANLTSAVLLERVRGHSDDFYQRARYLSGRTIPPDVGAAITDRESYLRKLIGQLNRRAKEEIERRARRKRTEDALRKKDPEAAKTV